MADRILDKAWSDVQPPDFVRFATPRFVRYGRVVSHPAGSDSLRVEFFEGVGEKAIPDARWYFVRGKLDPNAEEHLVVVDLSPMEVLTATGVLEDDSGQYPKSYDRPRQSHQAWISVQAACEMLKMDPKQLRRHIRRGVIVAEKHEDRWVIDPERLRDAAAKFGWI